MSYNPLSDKVPITFLPYLSIIVASSGLQGIWDVKGCMFYVHKGLYHNTYKELGGIYT